MSRLVERCVIKWATEEQIVSCNVCDLIPKTREVVVNVCHYESQSAKASARWSSACRKRWSAR